MLIIFKLQFNWLYFHQIKKKLDELQFYGGKHT